ncbi:MAG TPA: hypothetical protein VE174_13105 [Actinomycetota bacterium]|nr:hypothetical protein [Actinomycetota bacterium]
MRRLPLAALTCCSVALAALSLMAPGIAAAQSPTPSPTSTPSGASPSPSPTPTSPSPSPSASPTPTPTPTPSDDPGSTDEIPAVVDIRVSAPGGLAELGEHLSYSLLVVNPGDTPLTNLTITNIVPEELDVVGVPIIDRAESINLISMGSSEEIVWTLDTLDPGEGVTLPWEASVAATGDLVAANDVVVEAEDSSAAASRSVYLARSSTPAVQGGTSSAAPATTQTRRVVRYEQRRIPAGTAPAILPFTGANVSGWFALALILLGAGVVFTRARRSPALLCALMGLVIMAACTSADPPPSAEAPKQESPKGDDEVLGKRIHKGDNENTAEAPPGSIDDPSPGEEGDDDATEPDTETEDAITQLPVPQEDLIRVVTVPVVEIVEVQGPATEVLTSVPGDNLITFSWDEASRSVTGAASSRTLTRDVVATVLSELSTASPSIAPSVELTNVSDGSLVVKGNLGIETQGPGQTVTTSEHVDLVLAPGGSITLDFEYVLPSGEYTAAPFFQAD